MKREKTVPAELLAYIKDNRHPEKKVFSNMDIFCQMPVRAVKMKILYDLWDNVAGNKECYRTVAIPAVDIYVSDNAALSEGHLKRDALSYFISGTHMAFPYGHVYKDSGCICLGSIFVPSAIPERSPAMPLETLFLHNDRNVSHGGAHLYISKEAAKAIGWIINMHGIALSGAARSVIDYPGMDIIKNDEIWNLSADVVEQRPLPDALDIMQAIYDAIFKEEKKESEGQ